MEKGLILGAFTLYVASTHIPWLSTLAFVCLNFHISVGTPFQRLDHPSIAFHHSINPGMHRKRPFSTLNHYTNTQQPHDLCL
jgi:hypothetical protein